MIAALARRRHDVTRTGLAYEPAFRVYERTETSPRQHRAIRLEIDDSSPRHIISAEAVKIMLREMKQTQ